jgi:hypothetical protein
VRTAAVRESAELSGRNSGPPAAASVERMAECSAVASTDPAPSAALMVGSTEVATVGSRAASMVGIPAAQTAACKEVSMVGLQEVSMVGRQAVVKGGTQEEHLVAMLVGTQVERTVE